MLLKQHSTLDAAYTRKGFTLIELSIVLVIIGLIIGGILTGRDLINAAAIRAQVTQIERYNTASRTFQAKYGGIPGDLAASLVTQFGFSAAATRAGTSGHGDANGLIEGGCFSGCGSALSYLTASAESAWFWEDLSTNANLIDANLNYATDVIYPTGISDSKRVPLVLPPAKIGNGNYVTIIAINNENYFAVENPGIMDRNGAIGSGTGPATTPGLSVQQAYSMDAKVDDGLPQSGQVVARYVNWALSSNHAAWASGSGVEGVNSGSSSYGPSTAATAGTSTTCYDNANVAGVQKYSVGQSGGEGLNCSLSFKLQ